VKIAIPKTLPYSEDEPDGEHQLTMSDLLTLRRIMKGFDTFEHLEMFIKRGNLDQRHKLRHTDVLEWLDDDRWPMGCKLRDAFTAVLNVFGDEMVKKGNLPTGLPYKLVLAKGADDMAVSERTFKSQLNCLVNGKYIELSYGNIIFPAVKGHDSHQEA
jgi:hypothetical protein